MSDISEAKHSPQDLTQVLMSGTLDLFPMQVQQGVTSASLNSQVLQNFTVGKVFKLFGVEVSSRIDILYTPLYTLGPCTCTVRPKYMPSIFISHMIQ